MATPPVQLTESIYWFPGVTLAAVLVVDAGGLRAPLQEPIPEGSALDQALSWLDHLWDEAPEVPQPAFAVLEDALNPGSDQDGVITAR